MSKKLKGQETQLSTDFNELVSDPTKKFEFIAKYGQDIHDVMMGNFGEPMRRAILEHLDNLSDTNEELMKVINPLKNNTALFCAAFA